MLAKQNVSIKILTDEFIPGILNQIHKLNNGLLGDVIQIRNSSKLENIDECVMIIDAKLIFRIINNRNDSSRFVGMLATDTNQVLVQEILFEKYWNEVQSLSDISTL